MIARQKTAITRSKLSKPVTLTIQDGHLRITSSFFDYGCGRGDDIRLLSQQGYSAHGWDPAYFPSEKRLIADVVNLGYVINVVEDPEERAQILKDAWKFAQYLLVVSARLTDECSQAKWQRYGDGWLTSRGTFQKFYSHQELSHWVSSVLGTRADSRSPGIVYVFRRNAPGQLPCVLRQLPN